MGLRQLRAEIIRLEGEYGNLKRIESNDTIIRECLADSRTETLHQIVKLRKRYDDQMKDL